MASISFQPAPANALIHRIGGSKVDNLKLKAKEELLDPPGMSVFVGGTPDEAAMQIRKTFPHATRLLQDSHRIGSAGVDEIRQAGFDVVLDPTRYFENHARLIHPDGIAGFSDANLQALSDAFSDTELE